MKIIRKQFITFIFLFSQLILIYCQDNINTSMHKTGYDTTRIYKTMLKAHRGESVVIGVIGGSITNGYAASSEKTKWANLMTDWWKTTFPKSNITLVNAGIGGTGSDIAAHRVQNDLLKYKPDFVVVEFSVNDKVGKWASITMEGLLRQILKDIKYPGVMMLILKEENGTTALNSHKPLAEYYKIPAINFAELIDDKVKKDNVTLKSIYIDGLHPVDAGMKYIAGFIIDELNNIYNKLPENEETVISNFTLPKPLFSDLYENTNMFNNSNLLPVSNNGWKNDSYGWSSDNTGAEMAFKVKGKAVSVLYSRHNDKNRGSAEVWVDDNEHKKLDSYWTETWGPAIVFCLIADDLTKEEHTLHIKKIEDSPEGSTGNYFLLLNVLEAGESITPNN